MQPVKLATVPLKYPCIIYHSSEHHAPNCPKKAEVQNMFLIKPKIILTIATKNLKLNNVPVNVIPTITTCSQELEQQVFKERELVKAKAIVDW
jgi:hypothetical protein